MKKTTKKKVAARGKYKRISTDMQKQLDELFPSTGTKSPEDALMQAFYTVAREVVRKCPPNRQRAITLAKLEEACLFAAKSLTSPTL